jgi:carboxypeptidase Q
MAMLCDTYGNRLSGSVGLERAIDKCYELFKADGFVNVKKEPIKVPHWKRNNESLTLLEPHRRELRFLSLGGSVATPSGGISSEVFVVHDWSDLQKNADKIKGKIVVYDVDFQNYSQHVMYRVFAADSASKYGAVASLVRSVSPHGLQLPHTGIMRYNDSVPRIPHGAITMEESQMFSRIQARGERAVVNLTMNCETLNDVDTYNVTAELKGKKFPNSIIAIGGHIDSWDTGTGAQDDMGPSIATWFAVKLLKDLDLLPNHTIRTVLWGAEETGGQGGEQYAEMHKTEPHVLMLEADAGVYKPARLGYTGIDSMRVKLNEAANLLSKIYGKYEILDQGSGTDIRPMMSYGIPGMGFWPDSENLYFREHHSPSDTPDKVDPKIMNDCIAAIACTIYFYSMEFDGEAMNKVADSK